MLIGMGAAIRALQQDLPAILERQPELEHFAESVVFEDRLSPRLGLPAASCAGKEAYSRLCWSLRFHRTLFFSKAKVELQRMWERERGVICVRWSARAAPRLLDGLTARADATHMTLDGVSEFHFNERGQISKHAVDCVQYSGMQLQLPLLARMAAQRRAMVPGLAGGSFDEC